jgi:hypothetical protein
MAVDAGQENPQRKLANVISVAASRTFAHRTMAFAEPLPRPDQRGVSRLWGHKGAGEYVFVIGSSSMLKYITLIINIVSFLEEGIYYSLISTFISFILKFLIILINNFSPFYKVINNKTY